MLLLQKECCFASFDIGYSSMAKPQLRRPRTSHITNKHQILTSSSYIHLFICELDSLESKSNGKQKQSIAIIFTDQQQFTVLNLCSKNPD